MIPSPLSSPQLAAPAAITAARLQLFAPNSDFLVLAPALNQAAQVGLINTTGRVCHFMAQLHVESGGFTKFEECLDYSTASRLCEVWPARFPSIGAAAPFVNSPQALANKVYGGRLGNVRPGDGWLYRGRGLIELTGEANYAAGEGWSKLDLINSPSLASAFAGAATIAASFWDVHGLNAMADRGDVAGVGLAIHAGSNGPELDAVRGVTRVVNGGLTDLAARQMQFMRASAIWKG